MHPGRNKNTFLLCHLLRSTFRSDCEVLAFVSGQSPAESVPDKESGSIRVFFDSSEIFGQVAIGVGKTVGEVDLVCVVFKFISEGKSIVALGVSQVRVLSYSVLIVTYVTSSSMPTNALVFRLFSREGEHLHTVIV